MSAEERRAWEGVDAEWVDDVTVCVEHMRFVPCRRKEGCRLSSEERDVEKVRRYQLGSGAGEDLGGRAAGGAKWLTE